MKPVRELQLEVCDIVTYWQYRVYYINSGTRIYYEIWAKCLSEHFQKFRIVEAGASPLEALDICKSGGGYSPE